QDYDCVVCFKGYGGGIGRRHET
ncbi:hypothetical protein LCGC14_1977840, partial [marine sediment metagenome]